MKEGPNIAAVAALIGDPARAGILTALMSGKALTATELAAEAGVTPQTASTHLAKLVDGGLLTIRPQGRHRYASLASDDVARVLEGLMGLAAGSAPLRRAPGPKDQALRHARVCYNHLAGTLGIQLYDALRRMGHIAGTGTPELTGTGKTFVQDFGIALPAKTPLCRDCLDWSARKNHLAGPLGRAFLARFETLGWARRDAASRVVRFTPDGARAFARQFPAT
jgi:DNA-binding transcriptional ArsR family regulator